LYQTAGRSIPEASQLYTRRRENRKFSDLIAVFHNSHYYGYKLSTDVLEILESILN
jgi:hypothetical protein